MKIITRSIIVLLLINLFFCCGRGSESSDNSIVINKNDKFKDTTLILENFADDIRLIPLETNEDCLIRYFNGNVGEKYIIAFDGEKVLQFSGEGKFINTISTKGKGPDEFIQIDAWDVDDDEKFLFFHDNGKNYIKKYNLDEKKFEKDIPFEDKGYLGSMIAINDTLLAILRGSFSNYEHVFFYYSTNGNIIEGEKKDPVPHPGSWAGMSSIFKRAAENSIIYQPSHSDTIFKINGQNKEPFFSVQIDEPVINGDKTKGYFVVFSGQVENNIFLFKNIYESQITANSSSMRFLENEGLIYNLNNNKIRHISSIIYDALGVEFSNYLNFQNVEQLLLRYQALDFKEMIKKNIEEADLTQSERNRLEQLNSDISEDDNPILITGKCR
jgi:hypothetical protein